MTDYRNDKLSIAASAQNGPAPEPAGASAAGIGVDARRRIGRDLRLLYGSVLHQPLPERFTRLIDELAADSRNRKGS